MHPAAADHRRDDLHVGELVGLGIVTGRGRARRGRPRSPGASLPRRRSSPREPRRRDARRVRAPASTRHGLLRVPRPAVVQRPQHAGADARPAGRAPRSARRSRSRRPRRRPSSERHAYAPSSSPAQKRSARSRSEGACENCTDAATPSSREARDVLRREQLRVLDPLPEAERAPRVARRLERVERVAVRAVADRVHRDRAARAARRARTISSSSSRAVISTPAAVEQPRGLRAERAVHERLQVADAQERRRRGRGRSPSAASSPTLLVRERLPDAQRQRVRAREVAARSASAPSQPSLSCTATTPRRFASFMPARIASTYSSSAIVDVALAELPRRLLAQHAGRLAALVALDDAARHLEVAVRAGERGRVEPERVVVLRDQRGRDVAGDARRAPSFVGSTRGGQSPLRQPQPRSQPPGRTPARRRARARAPRRAIAQSVEPHLAAARPPRSGSARASR